jgi:hypothetical protein
MSLPAGNSTMKFRLINKVRKSSITWLISGRMRNMASHLILKIRLVNRFNQ